MLLQRYPRCQLVCCTRDCDATMPLIAPMPVSSTLLVNKTNPGDIRNYGGQGFCLLYATKETL
jgi:hypothetical protein